MLIQLSMFAANSPYDQRRGLPMPSAARLACEQRDQNDDGDGYAKEEKKNGTHEKSPELKIKKTHDY
ncbi:MAG: hypothetical protein H7203_06765 [Rhizobacter sp.]|nr:hypothetical protein [Burkholderiales bacterium]